MIENTWIQALILTLVTMSITALGFVLWAEFTYKPRKEMWEYSDKPKDIEDEKY